MSSSNNRDSLFAAECCARVRTLANIGAARLRNSSTFLGIFRWSLKPAKLLMSLVNALETIYLGLPEPNPSEDNTPDEGLESFLLRLDKLCMVCY
jgi:hypothetical protein